MASTHPFLSSSVSENAARRLKSGTKRKISRNVRVARGAQKRAKPVRGVESQPIGADRASRSMGGSPAGAISSFRGSLLSETQSQPERNGDGEKVRSEGGRGRRTRQFKRDRFILLLTIPQHHTTPRTPHTHNTTPHQK